MIAAIRQEEELASVNHWVAEVDTWEAAHFKEDGMRGKVLDLNETQTEILALIFKYCDDNSLPLLDLDDLATTLKYLSSDEGKPILEDYGGMSAASVGVRIEETMTFYLPKGISG